MEKVSVNKFVRRQVKGSGKTYSESLSFKDIAQDAEAQMADNHYKEGYRDGVRIIVGSEKFCDHFICPYVKLNEDTELVSKVVKRQKSEIPYIQTRAKNAIHLKTGRIEYILYRHDVLLENNEHTTNANWELISIHAIPEGLEKMPMGPITMMRNQLELPGGTKASYNSDEWAKSVKFWQEYVVLET